MWTLSSGATETLLDLAKDRLSLLHHRLDGDSIDDDERHRLERAQAELELMQREQRPMPRRIVLGLGAPSMHVGRDMD